MITTEKARKFVRENVEDQQKQDAIIRSILEQEARVIHEQMLQSFFRDQGIDISLEAIKSNSTPTVQAEDSTALSQVSLPKTIQGSFTIEFSDSAITISVNRDSGFTKSGMSFTEEDDAAVKKAFASAKSKMLDRFIERFKDNEELKAMLGDDFKISQNADGSLNIKPPPESDAVQKRFVELYRGYRNNPDTISQMEQDAMGAIKNYNEQHKKDFTITLTFKPETKSADKLFEQIASPKDDQPAQERTTGPLPSGSPRKETRFTPASDNRPSHDGPINKPREEPVKTLETKDHRRASEAVHLEPLKIMNPALLRIQQGLNRLMQAAAKAGQNKPEKVRLSIDEATRILKSMVDRVVLSGGSNDELYAPVKGVAECLRSLISIYNKNKDLEKALEIIDGLGNSDNNNTPEEDVEDLIDAVTRGLNGMANKKHPLVSKLEALNQSEKKPRIREIKEIQQQLNKFEENYSDSQNNDLHAILDQLRTMQEKLTCISDAKIIPRVRILIEQADALTTNKHNKLN